jgi:hypothetical protein
MRYPKYPNQMSRPQQAQAAVFVDYENLHDILNERVHTRAHPDELILEMIDEIQRHAVEELRTEPAIVNAYADFSALTGNGTFYQRSLHLHGAEPCFFPMTLQRNETELQLCVDAMDVVLSRPDISTFILVTGNRYYLPLVKYLRRSGRSVIVAILEALPSTERIPYLEQGVLIDAFNLLSETSRETVFGETEIATRVHPARGAVEYKDIVDEAAIRTLEIIEEYFGQYEEVYLTPLLRKLSELLEEEGHDPKTIINELEDAGAVWLEKRRGFPYDYTVLLVDTEHPHVRQIQQDFFERQGETRDYDDDSYEDENFGAEEEYSEDFFYDDYAEDNGGSPPRSKPAEPGDFPEKDASIDSMEPDKERPH